MSHSAYSELENGSSIESVASHPPRNVHPLVDLIHPRFSRVLFCWLALSLFVLPLAFGAVHSGFLWTSLSLTFALTLAISIISPSLPARILSGREFPTGLRLGGTIINLLLLFGAYCALHLILGNGSSEIHPLAQVSFSVPDFRSGLHFLLQLLGFICAFLLIRCWLADTERRFSRLRRFVLFSVFTMALIALGHWFYDTGELFWYFTPEHVFVSERARWPFVNSDHLAHFLAGGFFIFLGATTESFRSLFSGTTKQRQGVDFSALAFDVARQRKIISLTFLVTGLVSLMICLLATLSRGAWAAVTITTLLYFLADRSITRRARRQEEVPLENLRIKRSSRHRRSRSSGRQGVSFNFPLISGKQLVAAVKVAALVFAVILFYLLLSERGAELVKGRIEYGLLYSKQDIRWQLFSDTFKMIAEHPWFGVGVSGWAQLYPRYMAPLLAGVTPVYLHSDPLQILAETGIIGFSILSLVFIVPLWRIIIAIHRFEPAAAHRVLWSGCALLALVLSSVLDFPFRIPAIQFYTAVYLALLAFNLENATIKASGADQRLN